MKNVLQKFDIPIKIESDPVGNILIKMPPALYDKLIKECAQVLKKVQDNVNYKIKINDKMKNVVKEIEDYAMIISISKEDKSKNIIKNGKQ